MGQKVKISALGNHSDSLSSQFSEHEIRSDRQVVKDNTDIKTDYLV